MKHAQTIAMARGLLAEGRVQDVARMLEPLVEPVPDTVPGALEASQLVLRCLLARVRLLHYGDPARALALLKPFETTTASTQIEPATRAEGALWLGWTHTWQHPGAHDQARALHLLDEAEHRFRGEMNTAGRCWALLGKARAYLALDEYPLMLGALHEAAALQENVQDVQAALWTLDLHVPGAHLRGRHAQALAYAETLGALAQQHDDAFALGRAHAYRAAVYDALGRAPDAVVEAAAEAEALLTRAAVWPGRWLSAAVLARLRAEIRRGAWAAADRLIDHAREAAHGQPTALAPLLLERARLETARGRYAVAHPLLHEVETRLHPRQHRQPAFDLALAWSALCERQGQLEQAQSWAERACTVARETGHHGRHLQALLHRARLSLTQGDDEAARRYLAQTQPYSHYFSVLPVAALRFSVLGEQALAEDAAEEARAYFDQARAAYTLTGDLYHAARMQVRLAVLDRPLHPAPARVHLEAALATFERLEARPDRDDAQVLLDAWPQDAAPASETAVPDIGASLARASLSVDLIAETWLQAAERLLPGRWMGIYRCDEGRPWMRVREHSEAPASPPRLTEPCSTRLFADGVLWLRLRGHPGPAFFFGVALPHAEEPAWQAAHARIKPWIPVASLALDHALLHAAHRDAADGPSRSDGTIPLKDFVYAAPAMHEVAEQIHRIRASHSPVLITGERGAGKASVARALHAVSERKDAPFVTFDCASVADASFEGTLFGRAAGPEGALRAADGGTLFLDDVGALPLEMQRKLLRFLQDGAFVPVGGREPARIDAHLIAATHQDLGVLLRAGSFIEDLYYRLQMIPLHVPPLRERREDIPLLARHFMNVLRQPGTPLPSLTGRALEALLRYDWPGNVRQLRNEVERALALVRTEPAPLIDVEDLSPAVAAAPQDLPTPGAALEPGHDLDRVLAGTEKALIERVLAEHDGQVTASANALGLTRQGLYKKMKRLGIDASQFHPENA